MNLSDFSKYVSSNAYTECVVETYKIYLNNFVEEGLITKKEHNQLLNDWSTFSTYLEFTKLEYISYGRTFCSHTYIRNAAESLHLSNCKLQMYMY